MRRRLRGHLVFGLMLWLVSAIAAYAQPPVALRLDKRSSAAQVAPGDRLGFVLTLTNDGTNELTRLIVSDVTPEGTVFFGASGPRDWMITTPQQGGEGRITWRSTGSLGPGQSVELKLLVTVRMTGSGTLTSSGFTVQAQGWDKPLISPAVTVAVVRPTATPAPGWIDQAASQPAVWLALVGLGVILAVVILTFGLRRR